MAAVVESDPAGLRPWSGKERRHNLFEEREWREFKEKSVGQGGSDAAAAYVHAGQEGSAAAALVQSTQEGPATAAVQVRAVQEGPANAAAALVQPGQVWPMARGAPAAAIVVHPGQEGLGVGQSGCLQTSPLVTNTQDTGKSVAAQPGFFTFNAPRIASRTVSKSTWKRVNRNEATGKKGNKKSACVEAKGAKKMGNKRSALSDRRPTGSDLVFSFESTSADNLEFMLHDDVNVSCKRVCAGRVETLRGVDGVITHVSREIEGREEGYVQQRRESVGEEKGIYEASAASDEEDRRVK